MTSALRRRPQRRFPGLYRARVVDVTDPQQANRVQVTFPWLPRSRAAWAQTVRDAGGLPEAGDEVLVGFDAGHLARPYVLGIVASAAPPTVELADDNGNRVRMSTAGIDLTTSGKLSIQASTIHFSSGTTEADAGIWTFSGVMKAQTVITDSVIAANYTPGAGNLM